MQSRLGQISLFSEIVTATVFYSLKLTWLSLDCEKSSNAAATASQERHIYPCFSQLALQEKSSSILVTFIIPLAQIREWDSLT